MKISVIVKFVITSAIFCCIYTPCVARNFRVQLNWLHDPTFVAEYVASERAKNLGLDIVQGGPNIFPISEVKSGRSSFAVVGSDIFLRALAADLKENHDSDLLAVYVDFQRNPVGWVLHPKAGRELGFPADFLGDQPRANDWFFEQVAAQRIQVGDKRGTESTAIWLAWAKRRALDPKIPVIPVSFGASILLSAPRLAFPVYLNEEPYKLAEQIGEPLIIFDPAADGVNAYGNVVVTTRQFYRQNLSIVRAFQRSLTDAWVECMVDVGPCASIVSRYYRGVTLSVVKQQIQETVKLAFFKTETPGAIDLQINGRWHQTLSQVVSSGVMPSSLTLEQLREHVDAP